MYCPYALSSLQYEKVRVIVSSVQCLIVHRLIKSNNWPFEIQKFVVLLDNKILSNIVQCVHCLLCSY